jgi:general secretion pathway protein K
LAAIAFSLATTVRSETDRASNAVDGLRAYYLAAGGIHRATYELLWSVQNPDKRPMPRYSTHVDYHFPAGDVRVDIVPEAAKLDVNNTRLEELYRLGVALGLEPDRAREVAGAIVEWRTLGAKSLDEYYLGLSPTFRPHHASFEEIEELLLVKGITPDLYYGTYVPVDDGSGVPTLNPRPGLVDCLTVYGFSDGRIDANTAAPAVLTAIGLSPDVVRALVARRNVAPFDEDKLAGFLQGAGGSGGRLRVEGHSIVTMRSTARLRLQNGQLSDLRRSVGAQVKYMPLGYDAPIHILRWYDTAWNN